MTFCGLRFAVSGEKPDAKGPYYLQALCENLCVDFGRDSINAVTGHSISFLKETS